jgi:Beta-galactosidase/beta-glucuronidase
VFFVAQFRLGVRRKTTPAPITKARARTPKGRNREFAMTPISRRSFAGLSASLALAAPGIAEDAASDGIPDTGWQLWLDRKAAWQDDVIFLPEDVNLAALPVNPPTGGWQVLEQEGLAVTLPATAEQFFWNPDRPYTLDEFTYADTDTVKNGAYLGVSWWWRKIDIPAAFKGKRLILSIRGARQRAEVYLNGKLVGYSILEELPFDCDVTKAAVPGGKNVLAIRITNPGGRLDWVDGDTLSWGKVKIQRSHGFGGLDRGLTLTAHPMQAHLSDLWVLNTPMPGVVQVFASAQFSHRPPNPPQLHITGPGGAALAARFVKKHQTISGNTITWQFEATAANPQIWDLQSPKLYCLNAALGGSRRRVNFGFRWFTVDGAGKDARFLLNGRRIKLYSAISWGYWGGNGMWPTPDLAEKEVHTAKALGLNCLAFHRNPGKHDVLAAQDRLGLLRGMEPGGGKFAFGRLPEGTAVDQHSVVMQPAVREADIFCQRYVMAKILRMMESFRSHPSLIHWTLQNENNADFSDPKVTEVLAAMRAKDPSRIILMNDGMSSPEFHAAQAYYAPYDPVLHRSDKEAWGGWWDDHQGAGDQWYDGFYQDPAHFTYRNPQRAEIVHYGEMEGCAVPDNHTLVLAEIIARGGKSYDRSDHEEQLKAYQDFLSRWNFRGAFANGEALFRSLGEKCFFSWQNYMENVRLCDEVDYAAISGWETTAIDNHSGIVDNFRNPKADPALIAASLKPLRPVAKQRRLAVARGEPAIFDLYLLNDTGKPVQGRLALSLTAPSGREQLLAEFAAPAFADGVMSALVQEGFTTPPLREDGFYTIKFALSTAPDALFTRKIFVVDAKRPPQPGKTLKIAVTGVWPRLMEQLAQIPNITVSEYAPGKHFDAVITSGLSAASTPGQKLGGDDGLTLDKKTGARPVAGSLPAGLLEAVKSGLPLLLLPQEDGLADGLAKELAAAGVFSYGGAVGRYRAPWMGAWYFVREHALYAGMPVNRAMDAYYQARGRLANGLIIDGPGIEIVTGYSRDHDRRLGAGTFTAAFGKGKIVFQRVPDLASPLQLRFLSNALGWLTA